MQLLIATLLLSTEDQGNYLGDLSKSTKLLHYYATILIPAQMGGITYSLERGIIW